MCSSDNLNAQVTIDRMEISAFGAGIRRGNFSLLVFPASLSVLFANTGMTKNPKFTEEVLSHFRKDDEIIVVRL